MRRGKALIIDDEPDVAAYQGRILSDHGWQVRIALDGEQGLALALDETPDVILLDLMMPGGRGGLNTFMELRKNPNLKSIPVVFVTAFPEPDPDDEHSFLGRQKRQRPDAYLEKPVDPETLLATLDYLISTQNQTRSDTP
jgi:twitching motility two-component system response regulator PilH